jgi:DNA-binding XRE family transcriptional regulator
MDEPQTIRTPTGEELVVLSRQDYDNLVSALADAEEELADIATLDQRKPDASASALQVLPPEVCRRLLAGQRRLQAVREWRGQDRSTLAERLGLDEAALSIMETARTPLSPKMVNQIAQLLNVPADWISG